MSSPSRTMGSLNRSLVTDRMSAARTSSPTCESGATSIGVSSGSAGARSPSARGALARPGALLTPQDRPGSERRELQGPSLSGAVAEAASRPGESQVGGVEVHGVIPGVAGRHQPEPSADVEILQGEVLGDQEL